MSSTTYLAFVHTAPGLEPLLAQELEALLGPRQAHPEQSGGVTVRVSERQLFALCLSSRFAESVRVRLKSFIARDFPALEAGIGRLPWAAYLPRGGAVQCRVVCHRSRLWHSGAVTERITSLLERRFGVQAGEAETGALQIHVRITGDAVQASVDAGGWRLHRRGIRKFVQAASVRETLAAAVVSQVLHGELGPEPRIWDPFCGAGTLGLEALLWGKGLLPGQWRRFALETWPTHDAAAFAIEKEALVARAKEGAAYPQLRVLFSDRDSEALESARKNVASAGFSEAATFQLGSVEQVADVVPPGALIVANPPYGKRLEEGGAFALLLGVLEQRPDLRPVALLAGGPGRRHLPPTFRAALRTRSGGENVSVRVLDRGQAPR